MKKVVAVMLGLVCLFMVGKARADCTGTIFSDVNEASVGYQFCDYIERFSVLGITTGYGDGTYRPWNNVNRGQMATFFMRAIDNVVKPKGPIPNAEGEVCWNAEIVKGDPGTPQGLIKMNVRYLGDYMYLLEGGVVGSYSTGTARIYGNTIVGTLNQSLVDPESTHVGIAHISLDITTLNGTIEMIGHNYEQSDPTTVIAHNYSKWSMTLVPCDECSPGCPWYWLGDGYCDPACNVAACEFDYGDCQ